jgi:hypothetical protein
MPIIPTFDQQLVVPQAPGPPRADPNAAAAPGQALAQGAAQVSNVEQEWSNRYAEARRQADASNLAADASQGYDQLRQKWSLVPDRAAAQAGFNQEAATLRDATLAKTSDALVQGYLTPHLDQMGIIYSGQVGQEAFRRESSAQAAQLDQNGLAAQNRIASNPDPDARALEIDSYNASLTGAAAAGWITPEAAQARKTNFQFRISQDDVMRDSLADPVKTYNTLSDPDLRAKTYPYLPPEWADHFALRLEAKAFAHAGRTIGSQVFNSIAPGGGAAGVGDLSIPPIGGTADTGGSVTPHVMADTILQQESGGGQNNQPSVAGATGPGQIMPATFAQYARPGESIDNPADNQAVSRRVVSDLWNKNGGDPARVAVGYFSGPANVAPAGSPTPWIQDRADATGKTTSAYVSDVLARLRGAGGASGQSYPDVDTAVQKVMQATEGQPEQVRSAALSEVNRNINQYRVQTASVRSAVTKNFGDAMAALQAGKDDITIPEDDIRAAFPADQAQDMIGKLNVARAAGQVIKGVQWAPPDQLAATITDLSSGLGTKAGLPQGDPGAETPEHFVLRQKVLGEVQRMVAARTDALAKDPAGYVAANPLVADAFAKIQAVPSDAPDAPAQRQAAFQNYVHTTLATQSQLGVPDYQQHVLSAATAHDLTQKLITANPATTDPGAQLNSVAQQYGDAWPKVFGDLVTLGKLPREYQVLAAMDAPGQAPARADLTRALQATAQRGGMAALEKDAPPDQVRAINSALDDAIAPFRQTASIPGVNGNIQQIADIRDTIRQLALFKTIQGTDGATAVQQAADGILGQKYDFDGTMRAPKGMMPQVQAATASTLAGLQSSDLAPLPSSGDPKVDSQRSADALRLVKNSAFWVPNESDDGVVAYVRPRDGSVLPVTMANGKRLEMKFNALPQAAPPSFSAQDTQMPVMP